MHHHPRRIAATALLLTLALAGVVLAQVAMPVDWWVLGGGGGPATGDGEVTLDGTLGQPITGGSDGGDVALNAGYWQEDRRAAPTLALGSSANPSLAGGPLTLTATVSGSGATPTGTAAFKEGNTVLGSGSLNASGQATCDASGLAVGTHTISALYGGDTTYHGGSATLSQVVRLRISTTSIVAPAVTYHGDATVTVTVSSSEGAPAGDVALAVDGGAAQVRALDAAGQATYTVAGPTVGDHDLAATYAAQGNFDTSSATATLHVSAADTTTTVDPSSDPAVWGQTVTLSAKVEAKAPGSGTPTGEVTFRDGGTTLATRTLAGGVATFSTSDLAIRDHTIAAEYAGDGNYLASSGTRDLTVNRAETTTDVVGAPASTVHGELVTFTAAVTVDAPGSGTPTGTVTFKEGNTTLGTGTLDALGVATFLTTSLSGGSHTITAEYGGDGNAQGSSDTCSVDVAKASTTTGVSATPAASVYGQAVTFTATVCVEAPGGGTPSGIVTLKAGGASIGSGTLDASGVATLATSTLAVGSHTITARYEGDGNLLSSNGSLGADYVVDKASTTTAIIDVTPGPTSLVGQVVAVRYGVSVTAPGAGTPTGTVTVSDGIDSCSGGVADGSCSLALSTAGDRTLTAAYAGDGSYEASTSPGVPQHVNTPPVADAGGPYSGDEATPIAFDGSGSYDADADQTTPLDYQWTFGDGATGSGATPSHTYRRPGSYIATLTVADHHGATNSNTAVVRVRNVAPVLSGQYDQAASEGRLTTFDLGRFADPGAGPWAVTVEWGDGMRSTWSVAAAGALVARHHYDDDDSYGVTVTVVDDHGASGRARFKAVIRNAAPKVRIDPRVTPGPGGVQVGLWAQVTDPSRADTRHGFEYRWSLKRDGVETGRGTAASLGFTMPAGDGALYVAEVSAEDKDGGIGHASWQMRLPPTAVGVDARIQILWPHGGLPVGEATLANLSAWLLEPGTLHPATLAGEPVVYLWRALNNGGGEIVATGVRRGSSMLYDFNNVDVAAAREAKDKLFFWVSVAGVPTRSNVWVHAQDGRTWFPAQDVPTGAGYSGSPVEARIEILWPHGGARVRDASLANLTALLFRPGGLESVSPDWSPTVRLWRALDNGVVEEVASGVKRLVTKNGLTYPVWDFNDVDVSAARDPAHKLIFTLTVDGVETRSSVWVHGADARTVFPEWDAIQ